MRYQTPLQGLFIKNRKKFVEKLLPKSLAVFHSNDIMPTNADGTMRFRQNNDLLYLTGIDQEETILVLCPDFPNEQMREILFLRKTNEHIAVMEGHKCTQEQAYELTGIKNIQWAQNFEGVLNTLAALSDNIDLNTNDHQRADIQVETRDARYTKNCQKRY